MGDEFLDTFYSSYSDVYTTDRPRVSTVEVRRHLKELPLTDRLRVRSNEKIRVQKNKKVKITKAKIVNNENIDFYNDSHQFQVTKQIPLQASVQELNHSGVSTSLPATYNEFASNAVQKDGNFLSEIKSKIDNNNTYASNIKILSTIGPGKRKIQLDKRINYKTIIDQVNEDFHKWHTLEQRYLDHIHSLCTKITHVTTSFDDSMVAHKNQLLLLLVATRKIHYKIVETYQQSVQILKSPRLNDSSKDLQEYMQHTVSSLLHIFDFLDIEPILSFTGMDSFRCNPFIVTKADNHNLHPVLVMANDEHLYMDYFRVIHNLHEKKQRIVQHNDHNRHEGAHNSANKSVHQTPNSDFHGENKLTPLRIYEESVNDNDSDCSNEDLVTNLLSSPFRNINLSTRLWWMRWKKNYHISTKISYHVDRKKLYKVRKVFNAMQQFTWQSIQYNRLQKKHYTATLYQTFNKWDQYRRWCRVYNALFKRSEHRVQSHVINALRINSMESTQVRSFYRKQRDKRNKLVFELLRYNSIFNKFELRNRLRTGSALSFWNKHLLAITLKQWRFRCDVVNALDFVDDKIDKLRLKRAFHQFARNTVSSYARFQRLKHAANNLNASIMRMTSNQISRSKDKISTFLINLLSSKNCFTTAAKVTNSSPVTDEKRKIRILGAMQSSI